jgi:hypothetical protein
MALYAYQRTATLRTYSYDRRKVAGLFEAPPAMLEEILEWVMAVAAASSLQEAEEDLRRAKKNHDEYEAKLKELLRLAKSFASKPVWKTYKALYEAQWVFGHPGERWSVRDFQKMTPEKQKVLQDRADEMLGYLQNEVRRRSGQFKASVKKYQEQVKDLKKRSKGEKPIQDGKPLNRDFKVNTKGWKHDRADLQDLLEEHLAEEKARGQRLLDKALTKDTSDPDIQEFIEIFREEAEKGKGYPQIMVQLTLEEMGQAGAVWWPAMRMIKILMPKRDAVRYEAMLRKNLQHELRHFAQSYLNYVLKGTSFGQQGLPSKKIRTPQYSQAYDPDNPNRPSDYEEVYQKLRSRGINPEKVNWHDLDDVEFYTVLPDAIDEFKRLFAGSNRKYLEGAVKLFTGAANVGRMLRGDDWDAAWQAELDRVGVDSKVRAAFDKPHPFFLALRRRARAKWKKAVAELYKAVS